MSMTFNRELFIEAYEILDGIPDERFNLSEIANKKELDCGTLACGMGWLAMHPKFQALGLTLEEAGDEGVRVALPGFEFLPVSGYDTIARELFGFSGTLAPYHIFRTRCLGERGTDKQVLLKRMRNYLRGMPV
jgi:hypothetical protein